MEHNIRKKWIFRISIFLNIIFILGCILNYLNSPTYNLGVLKEDVNVGTLGGEETYFKIPKGITVRDISEKGLGAIGQFENERFEIVITSDRDIVDYNAPKNSISEFGNFFSADVYPGKAR